jgi:FtsP/CotA-like multicopper oxidase with cupredoxin domain
MAGLVLGISVTGTTPLTTTAVIGARHLRLVVGQRAAFSLRGVPGLGYRLAETGSGGSGEFTAPGPPIVLTRGQPVEIAVTNELSQATSVHWPGIELESYYDGIPGWGGDGKQITPPIRPGETFVARFTPPREGTFIYHTHLNDYIQLSTGLYGPLIVMEPGQLFEPELEKIFVLSRGGPNDDRDPFLINGSAFPGGIELRAGRRYRFRIIGITPALRLEVTLHGEGHTENWRAIAKDGAALPSSQTLRGPARVAVLPGETYDFEFRPASAGHLRLTAVQPLMKFQVEVPIIVRRP